MTRGLLVALAVMVAANVAQPAARVARWRHTAVARAGRFFQPWRPHTHNDSWRFMIRAYEEFHYADPEPIYPAIFFGEEHKFQYPPTSLLLLEAGLAVDRALHGGASVRGLLAILNALSWLSVLALVYCSIRITLPSGAPAGRERFDAIVRAGAIFALVLIYYPVLDGYELGQVQTLISALFAGAVWRWLGGGFASAGALVGVACLFKPQYSVIVLWAALRRHRRFTAGALVVVAAGAAASVALFGLENHLDYAKVLGFIGARGELYTNNHSVNGVLNRLRWPDDPAIFEFTRHTFPNFDPVVFWGTFWSWVGSTAFSLAWRARGPEPRASVTELMLVTAVCTIVSPVAWRHHYGVLVPIYALLAATADDAAHPRRLRAALLASAILTGLDWEPVARRLHGAALGLPLSPLQATTLWGACIAIACLLRSGRPGRALRPTPRDDGSSGSGEAPVHSNTPNAVLAITS